MSFCLFETNIPENVFSMMSNLKQNKCVWVFNCYLHPDKSQSVHCCIVESLQFACQLGTADWLVITV